MLRSWNVINLLNERWYYEVFTQTSGKISCKKTWWEIGINHDMVLNHFWNDMNYTSSKDMVGDGDRSCNLVWLFVNGGLIMPLETIKEQGNKQQKYWWLLEEDIILPTCIYKDICYKKESLSPLYLYRWLLEEAIPK